MQTIIRIEYVEELKDKRGKTYFRTHAVLSDGSEAVGYGKAFDLGMKVMVFFHYGQTKMRQKLDK